MQLENCAWCRHLLNVIEHNNSTKQNLVITLFYFCAPCCSCRRKLCWNFLKHEPKSSHLRRPLNTWIIIQSLMNLNGCAHQIRNICRKRVYHLFVVVCQLAVWRLKDTLKPDLLQSEDKKSAQFTEGVPSNIQSPDQMTVQMSIVLILLIKINLEWRMQKQRNMIRILCTLNEHSLECS